VEAAVNRAQAPGPFRSRIPLARPRHKRGAMTAGLSPVRRTRRSTSPEDPSGVKVIAVPLGKFSLLCSWRGLRIPRGWDRPPLF